MHLHTTRDRFIPRENRENIVFTCGHAPAVTDPIQVIDFSKMDEQDRGNFLEEALESFKDISIHMYDMEEYDSPVITRWLEQGRKDGVECIIYGMPDINNRVAANTLTV